MEIKTAHEHDVKKIMRFESELFRKWDRIDPIDKIDESWFGSKEHEKRILEYIKDKKIKIFLAFEGSACQGFLKAEIREREPFLQHVGYVSEAYIIPESRGKAVGSRLLESALDWFRKNDLSWTTVSTHSEDVVAIGFWEKKGFREYNKFFKMKI